MKTSNNKIVSLIYTLREDNENGEIVEQLNEERPLKFLFGSGQLLKEFENNINGLGKGEAFSFNLSPENAYGEVIQDAIVTLNKNIFIIDGVLRDDLLQIGKIIPMRDNNGNPLSGKVIEITSQEVKIDFNHPMAGKSLHFKGEIIEVAEASAKEIAQGYPEGMGGGCGSGGCGGGCSCDSGGEESCCSSEGDDSSCGCGSGCGCH